MEASPEPRKRRWTRRRFLALALVAAPAAAAADALWLEPGWLAVRRVSLGTGLGLRVAHFTDLHHDGRTGFLEEILRTLDGLAPDFACFTGDIVSDGRHLDEALEGLASLSRPVFGVPGNHDSVRKKHYPAMARAFRATGGAWLVDQETRAPGSGLRVAGLASLSSLKAGFLHKGADEPRLLLVHYPAWADRLEGRTFTALLAGHSHGGQVRLPLAGPLILPGDVGPYDRGLYHTAAGPLFVSSGLGTFGVRVRFGCRPEIVLLEL